MARVCELSGTRPFTGNKVSHSNIKSPTRWLPNLKSKKYSISELGRTVSVYLTARSIRTIDKQGGIVNAVMKAKEDKLSPSLLRLKRDIVRARKA